MSKIHSDTRPSHRLTVSIVYYDTEIDLLFRSIHSLLRSIDQYRISSGDTSEFRIILVNNSKTPLRAEFIDSEIIGQLSLVHCAFKVVEGHGNVGYGRGHNIALSESDGEYSIVMNPDVTLAQDCISKGLDFLRQNPSVIAISPECRDRFGRIQHLCKSFPSVLVLALRGFAPPKVKHLFRKRLARYEMHHINSNNSFTGVPIISGCFILLRQSALEYISGFDERYFLYFEDFDLSLRLRAQGDLAYVSDMKIEHYGGNAARKGPKHVRMFLASSYKFFRTHGWKWI